MKRNSTEFAILPAFHGDCILIKTYDINNDEFIILIDGGTAQTFRYTLKAELKDVNRIDLLILTHIDSDHIAGLISLFKSSLIDNIVIDEIWMNHPEIVEINNDELISTKQGDSLKELILLKNPDVKLIEITTLDKSIIKSGVEFIILSPTPQIKEELYRQWQLANLPKTNNDNVNISSQKEVYSNSLEDLSKIPFSPDKNINNDIFNSSSISFVLKCLDVSILLLADSRSEIITESLRLNCFNETKPLEVDYVKVSHHGSLNNTSQEQLGLIQSNNFIISTNGGTADHKHPSRETIARIVYNSQRKDEVLTIYFNYKIDDIKERIGDFINDTDFEEGNWNAINKNWF
ncbi:MBL fold metallo-hydrolase [Flavobacterium sp. M31R6]|jgi:beta-lactamase superfamily II metal-dependent hydrolase|uniref:ComEC/Rec2 family competence protein n=1 Tax=Flavobacterium sp. M31R6 TaxID=2739062 RepID=UPI001569227C|nr:MBL fold metallo-hydrolase [Flavobacterium sp. M31R6]QKJ64188.1 MBL fold metallo-hydrolase [Flavobacterium sp. M31R6]